LIFENRNDKKGIPMTVADVNVDLFKAWLKTKSKKLEPPGWISEYA
jgi:hypothetical protein